VKQTEEEISWGRRDCDLLLISNHVDGIGGVDPLRIDQISCLLQHKTGRRRPRDNDPVARMGYGQRDRRAGRIGLKFVCADVAPVRHIRWTCNPDRSLLEDLVPVRATGTASVNRRTAGQRRHGKSLSSVVLERPQKRIDGRGG